MSDIAIDIVDLLNEGLEPSQVAYRLGIPLDWVFSEIIQDMMVQQTEDCPVA